MPKVHSHIRQNAMFCFATLWMFPCQLKDYFLGGKSKFCIHIVFAGGTVLCDDICRGASLSFVFTLQVVQFYVTTFVGVLVNLSLTIFMLACHAGLGPATPSTIPQVSEVYMYCEIIFVLWTFIFMFFVGRAILELTIPQNIYSLLLCCILFEIHELKCA